MKKIIFLMALLLIALLVVACGNSEVTKAETTTAGTGADTTVGGTAGTTGITTGTQGTAPITPDCTTTPNTLPSDAKLEETEDYTAVLDESEFVGGTGTIDYDFVGDGKVITNRINSAYNGYTKTYFILAKDGTKTESSRDEVRAITYMIGASAIADKTAKTVEITVEPCELVVQPSWKSVTARAGSYLMFEFTTNFNSNFYMTVTADEGGSKNSAAYTQGGVTVTGADGKYTGIAKCTVPYAPGKTFYINICLDGTSYPIMATVPVTITTAKYDSPYSLIFEGDWELVKREDYLSDLIDLFYNVYPRVYERFGTGDEPKVITFKADKNYDGVAYNAGTLVCVSTDYANSNPYDIGFFAHEITHAVQQYGNKMYYGDGAWWTEFMADLGRFRYFHWGYSTQFPKFYSMDDPAIRDWDWQPYGQHNIFAAYLDSRYPTTKAADGTITYGLVDSINNLIKNTNVLLYDDPYKEGSPFNNVVKEITGYATMEALRLHFVEELDNGTWEFIGYRDYLDNFQTEDIPGVPNPTYPMLEPVKKGDKTAPVLDTPVTEGTNLALNATIVEVSSNGTSKNQISNVFDGDLTTKWQAGAVRDDYKYELAGYQHEFIIDLGEAKKFDTYTLVNAGIKENDAFNTKEWELFVSDDGKTWTSVDYQKDMASEIVSVNVGDTTARYVMLRVFATDRSESGTVRLYEFMLFDQ